MEDCPFAVWWMIYWQCHTASGMGAVVRTAWPDGKSAIAQPLPLVQMFAIISTTVAEASQRD